MPVLLDTKPEDDEPVRMLILSGSDRGKRLRIVTNTLIHRGPTEPRMIDECRLFVVNVGVDPARLYLNDGRTAERVYIIPGRSELVPIGHTLQTGDVLTGRADLKNIYVWGKAIRRREPPPSRLQRAIAWLSLLWLDIKGAIGYGERR